MMPTLRILHVEDDPDIRMIARLALELDPAIVVRSAESGQDALRFLDDGAWRPDLLLLDVMMPDMNGLGLLSHVRGRDAAQPMAVIFMTARARPGDLERYLAAGALGLIVKPFDPVTLSQQIRRLMAGT